MLSIVLVEMYAKIGIGPISVNECLCEARCLEKAFPMLKLEGGWHEGLCSLLYKTHKGRHRGRKK